MSKVQVLIIDDEADVCTFFRRLLQRNGYGVVTATRETEAREALERQTFNVAMVDLKLPDTDGLTLLRLIKSRQPSCEVVIMTGYSTIKTAVQAIQLGAYEYLEKPFEEIEEIENLVAKAAAYSLKDQTDRLAGEEWAQAAREVGFEVGTTQAMRSMVSLAYKIANKDINALIQGKTGTGKEVLARFIHAASNRSDQMFIPINCGALPENLLESELFGHERGAFTGAAGTRRGIFELANRGTLFLDEIGDASPMIQVKLLRVLETGEFMRVGGEKPIKTDVRVISATNVDLEEAIRKETFREDLFYRLNVVRLEIPPLHSRSEDIPLLTDHFLRLHNPELSISPEAMRLLCAYPWPGNIRELANAIRQAAVLCDEDTILPRHLADKLTSPPSEVARPMVPEERGHPGGEPPSMADFWEHYGKQEVLEGLAPGDLTQMYHSLRGLEDALVSIMRKKGLTPQPSQSLKTSELEIIRAALEKNRWNITETAKALGIARNTLHRKIKKYGLRDA